MPLGRPEIWIRSHTIQLAGSSLFTSPPSSPYHLLLFPLLLSSLTSSLALFLLLISFPTPPPLSPFTIHTLSLPIPPLIFTPHPSPPSSLTPPTVTVTLFPVMLVAQVPVPAMSSPPPSPPHPSPSTTPIALLPSPPTLDQSRGVLEGSHLVGGQDQQSSHRPHPLSLQSESLGRTATRKSLPLPLSPSPPLCSLPFHPSHLPLLHAEWL